MPFLTTKVDFNKMRSFTFFGLIIILGVALLYVFRPFFYPIFWAATIAIFFYPWYQNICARVKSKELSAFLTICLVLVLLFLPLTLVALLIYNQAVELYLAVSRGLYNTNLTTIFTHLQGTIFGPYLEYLPANWTDYVGDATKTASAFLVRNLGAFTQNLALFVFKSFITIYTLYYFFKDGPRILKRLMHMSPLGDEYEAMLFERFTSTARATLKGSFILGGLQGILGGILFAVTGMDGFIIWGVLMAVFAMIPAMGAFVVWFPAGIFMLATGHTWQGVTIILVGAFVISLIDNILRPPLVGKDTQMHPLLILFSTLGGIAVFGMSGLVIGPIIAALFLAVMSIYDHYYKRELSHN